MRSVVATVAVLVVLAGCSDPKAANKSNFKAAIDKWGEANPSCLEIPDGNIKPAANADAPFPRYLTSNSTSELLAPFDALVSVGLMKATQASITVKDWGMSDPHQMQVRAYDLTDEGKKAVKKVKGLLGGFEQQFCYGTPTVDEITQFTEPADMMGVKASEVHYKYHLKDVPGWEYLLCRFVTGRREPQQSHRYLPLVLFN